MFWGISKCFFLLYIVWGNHKFVWFTLYTCHTTLVFYSSVTLCCCVIKYEMRPHWFVSPFKSVCCNEASGLWSQRMLRLWTWKTKAFHLLKGVMKILKSMNNLHQNMWMFIRDWSDSSSLQIRSWEKDGGLLEEWQRKWKDVWSEFGHCVISLMA